MLRIIQTGLLLLPLPLASLASSRQALERQQLSGEAQLRPRPGDRVVFDGRALAWQEHRSPQAVVDFNVVLGHVTEQCVAYAVCYLESDRPRKDLRLQVGSDDQAKVYINGEVIYQSRVKHALDGLDTVGPVVLEQGNNVLLFKVVNGTGSWEGCVRLVDEAGRPAQGIRVKLTPE